MHIHVVTSADGNTSGVIPFCSDPCHREWHGSPAAWTPEREQRFCWLVDESLNGWMSPAESAELRELKAARDNSQYEGWNGAHESPDYDSFCALCGVIAGCGPDACECQRSNVLVNRFRSDTGEQCRHGNWIQLSRQMMAGQR